MEHVPPRVVYRGARSRSKAEADALHDAAADRRRGVALGRPAVPLRGLVARRRIFDGIARRSRRWPDRRSDHHNSITDGARVAWDALRSDGRGARRADLPNLFHT